MATTINSNTTDGIVITPDTSGEIELQANGVTKAKVTANGLQDANGNSLRGGMYRNLIINGDMRIAQRGTSSTGQSNVGGGYRTVDRFAWQLSASMGTWTQEQSTDAPEGFSYSLKHTCTSTATIGANNDAHQIFQRIEGQNLQHLNYGTSNAQSITASFWVKSNLTGVYTVSLYGNNGSSTRQIGSTITINSANTWENKTVTFVGDTVNILQNNNGQGLSLSIWLACGTNRYSSGFDTSWVNYNALTGASPSQTQLGTTISDYFNITGVQLEVGEGASDFEHLPYDVQLQRCQRYYYRINNSSAYNGFSQRNIGLYNTTAQLVIAYNLPVSMRGSIAASYSDLTHFDIEPFDATPSAMLLTGNNSEFNGYTVRVTDPTARTIGFAGILVCDTATGFIDFDAEL